MTAATLPNRPGTMLPRWRTIAAVGVAGLAWAAIHDWSQRHAFMINASESLPNWAFLVEKRVMPRLGQYAFFRVRETPLIRAHFGEHPQPFGKLVYGVAGDLVSRKGHTVLVNGAPVAVLKAVSSPGGH